MLQSHTSSSRVKFRVLGRNWHTCLGYGLPLPRRDESTGLLDNGSSLESDLALHGTSCARCSRG
jgi:hypothetical protein